MSETLAPYGDWTRIRAESGGMALEAQVDPETHRVVEISGNHPSLEPLCRVSRGYTVQDVSEHAVIRLESLLRNSSRRPVPGVVQPQNAGEAYRQPLLLVRALLKDYQAKTGYKVQPNFEEGPIGQASSEWGTSTLPERIQRILAALPEVCCDTGVLRSQVRVESVAGPRVTLGLDPEIPEAAKGRYLLLQELRLRAEVEPRIELFLHDRKDANAKRQDVLPAGGAP